jgi:hypothetical protein
LAPVFSGGEIGIDEVADEIFRRRFGGRAACHPILFRVRHVNEGRNLVQNLKKW